MVVLRPLLGVTGSICPNPKFALRISSTSILLNRCTRSERCPRVLDESRPSVIKLNAGGVESHVFEGRISSIAQIPESLASKPNPSALGSREAAKSGGERTGSSISHFDNDQRPAIARHDVDLIVAETHVAFQYLPAPRRDQFGDGALCPIPSCPSEITQCVHVGFIGGRLRIRAQIRT